jgi:hypothetical protein
MAASMASVFVLLKDRRRRPLRGGARAPSLTKAKTEAQNSTKAIRPHLHLGTGDDADQSDGGL